MLVWAQKSVDASVELLELIGQLGGGAAEPIMESIKRQLKVVNVAKTVVSYIMGLRQMNLGLAWQQGKYVGQEVMGLSQTRIEDLSKINEDAERSIMCLKMFAWAVEICGETALWNFGRYETREKWVDEVEQRRQFNGKLLIDAKLPSGVSYEYPPHNPAALITSLLMNDSNNSNIQFEDKQALVLYCLFDCCTDKEEEICKGFKNYFGTSIVKCKVWSLCLGLDKAGASPNRSTELDSLFSVQDLPIDDLPMAALEKLSALGKKELALNILDQRSKYLKDDVYHAAAALGVKLSSGLVIEAFMEMKEYIESSPKHAREKVMRILFHSLMEWAAREDALLDLTKLPISTVQEEGIFISWLLQAHEKSKDLEYIMVIIVYFLFRGRNAEAVYYYGKFASMYDNEETKSFIRSIIQVISKRSQFEKDSILTHFLSSTELLPESNHMQVNDSMENSQTSMLAPLFGKLSSMTGSLKHTTMNEKAAVSMFSSMPQNFGGTQAEIDTYQGRSIGSSRIHMTGKSAQKRQGTHAIDTILGINN